MHVNAPDFEVMAPVRVKPGYTRQDVFVECEIQVTPTVTLQVKSDNIKFTVIQNPLDCSGVLTPLVLTNPDPFVYLSVPGKEQVMDSYL